MQLIDSLLYMLNEMSPYILLGFLIAGLMHAFVSQQAMGRHLAGTGIGPVTKAALFGIPLPLCSCGVLPTAIAMRRSGASRAASTSFLVATPQTGVDSIAATWSLLGPAFAVIRPVAALVVALGGGLAVGKVERTLGSDSPADEHTHNHQHHAHSHQHDHGDCTDCHGDEGRRRTFGQKVGDALRYGFVDLVSSIGGWLVVGLIIAALITVYVPDDFFTILGSTPLLSMIAVLVVAVPMYVCATGSIPIAMSLMLKGLSPGTAFVLLMAGPAANFASFTLISREMGRKAAAVYLGSIVVGALAIGLAIDYLMPAGWFTLDMQAAMSHHHHISWLPTVCSAILVSLLAYSYITRKFHKSQINTDTMTEQYQISGMNCPHCQAAVTRAIAAVRGVEQVEVDLKGGLATVEGSPLADAVVEAVRAAGFDAKKCS